VTRARSQAGFTLPELLVTMSISMVILLGAFALLDTVMKRTGETQGRVEATQAGRQALDVMTRQLRSQVCPSTGVVAIADASPNSITFYTDLTNGSLPQKDRVEKRVLAYDPATRRITESIYRPTGADPIAFATTPTTRELIRNVVPDGSQPLFRYFAFSPATATTAPQLSVPLVNPAAGDRARIAQIRLAFVVKAGKGVATEPASITLRDDVYVRSANPNDSAPTPLCA
jgi:prepilin-type N-terminal cleavage/methylation domain-containing protein